MYVPLEPLGWSSLDDVLGSYQGFPSDNVVVHKTAAGGATSSSGAAGATLGSERRRGWPPGHADLAATSPSGDSLAVVGSCT